MNLSEIRQRAAEYDNANKTKRGDTLPRLLALVEQHGTSAVAAASGLNESTIQVYCRSRKGDNRMYPSEYAVTKAEAVLRT
jgi:hypothetical protein